MSRKRRMQNLREAKDKRMKKVAVGGAVLLAVVLAFELSHMLGGGGSKAAASTTTTAAAGAPATATPASTPTATPPGTAAAAVLPTTGSTKLPNSDLAPRSSRSELVSFSHFAGKDPFVQQVSAGSSSSSTPPPATGTLTSAPSTGLTASGSQSARSHLPVRTLAQVGGATISVNGERETVRVGGSFPSSNPLFRLVSFTNGVAKIGIASGSYASGAPTVSLVSGRSLTLVDTADGIRYKLRLVSGA